MSDKVLFRRKAGLGTHRFKSDGALLVVRGGGTVECYPHELGSRFVNGDTGASQYLLVNPDALPLSAASRPPRTPEVVPDAARGFYNVVNPDYPDRPLNDKRLRKLQAEEFLKSLVGKPLPAPDSNEDDAE